MSIEENKRVAARFFERFSANDIPGVLDLLAEDASYWILGRREIIPTAGTNSKKRIAAVFEAMASQLQDGLKMRAISMIAEGDRVAVEAESHGTLKNGRVYNNQYHMAMTIRDGKIVELREYMDTQHVLETWFT